MGKDAGHGAAAPEREGLTARPRLGQHFLIKGSLLERIAAAVCPTEEPVVIEIGPGRGALTERLLRRAARVIGIELDAGLVEYLSGKFAGDGRLTLVHQDVLSVDLEQWGPAPIVGNLPYYITSPILDKISRVQFPRAVFLVQKEVADRLAAQPGGRDYGFLTVQIALRAEVKLLFDVKPSAFHPPPKVDSAVVLLQPRPLPDAVVDPQAFLRFVAQCFRHKRKILRNNLAGIAGVDAWPEAGLRAEQISLAGFVEIYQRSRRSLPE